MPARPATMPTITIIELGLLRIQDAISHTVPLVTAASCVEASVEVAMAPEVSAEPALKPNHPPHNMHVPIAANGKFDGGNSPWYLSNCLRRPNIIDNTNDPAPALV